MRYRYWMGIMCRPGQWEAGFFRQMQLAGKRNGIGVYVFSPDDLHPEAGWVLGRRWGRSGWHTLALPLPNVVYNRIYYGRSIKGQELKRAVTRWRRRYRPIFLNTVVLGKWKSFLAARQDEEVAAYLPETRLLQSWSVLHAMLATHGSVFIKPVFGLQGKGVARITRTRNAWYVKARDWRSRIHLLSFQNRAAMHRFLANWIGGRKVVCQQYLHLDWWHQRPADLRILLQKDGSGEWQITGMAARIGRRSGLTSNLHGGAGCITAEKFIEEICSRIGENAAEKMEELRRLSLNTATCLENGYGRMGELGLDIGLDVRGRYFLLECNTQPGRRVFLALRKPHLYQLAVERPVLYALHLARLQGRTVRNQEESSSQGLQAT